MLEWLNDQNRVQLDPQEPYQWPKTEEDQYQPKWPDTIEHGFEMIYGEYIPDEEVEAFASRWNGLDDEAFVRAFREGQGDDRLLAICLLGCSDHPHTSSLLHPLLQSSQAKERWLAAVCLGRRRDEAARATLVRLLTEFLPTERAPMLVEDQFWFDEWRYGVADLLRQWEDPNLVSAFRQALMTALAAERYIPDGSVKPLLLQTWYSYQDLLSQILGEREAFSALTGLELSPVTLRIFMVNMALGSCHFEERCQEKPELRIEWQNDEPFRNEVAKVLGQRFGLSEEEQQIYADGYFKDYYAREEQLKLLFSGEYLKLQEELLGVVKHHFRLPEEERQPYLDSYAHDSDSREKQRIEVNVVRRGTNTLIVNTRSTVTLLMAGVDRSAWNVIDRTGDVIFEEAIDQHLANNGLTEAGIDFVKGPFGIIRL